MRLTPLAVVIVALSLLLSLWEPPQVRGCYAVIVGRAASADGSVLVGHNEQNGGRRILNFRRVPRQSHPENSVVRLRRGGTLPQVPQTWAFLWSENPGLENSDAYLNQWGVGVVSDSCPSREDDSETLARRGQIRDGGIGYMLRRLVVERSRTAREGVETAGELVERFGYFHSGRTYVIADPNEAWLFSAVRGRHWVAQRVPDQAVVVLPNVYIIGEVDLEDAENFLGSSDLIDYATGRGWFDPDGGEPFNFRTVYRADYDGQRRDAPDGRRWRGRNMASGIETPWPPAQPPPLGLKPPRKLTVAAVAAILRITQTPSPLSTSSTQEAAVFQLRRDMPKEIGCVYWRTTAEPSTSVLTPWYLGITETPENYYRGTDIKTQLGLDYHFDPPQETFELDPQLAWWKFKTLQDLVREDFESRVKVVQPVWTAFEQQMFRDQPTVEETALELWETDQDAARTHLTRYCSELAARVCREADKLAEVLRDAIPDDLASPDCRFTISIDEESRKKWGFQYPVTYVFQLPRIPANAEVLWRGGTSADWTPLETKAASDFFNGVQCVRFDRSEGKAYVSVGFGASNTVQLKFVNAPSVSFDSVARYYDDRKAAYTLSNDNWGRRTSSNPGAPWKGMTNDASDKYQASVHACRTFQIPVTIAVNSQAVDAAAMWDRMREELGRTKRDWEPAVHTTTHPCSRTAYAVHGYEKEILGCRDDILAELSDVPYGQHLFTFILPCGYEDADLEKTASGEFLFLRAWNQRDNPSSTDYVPWNAEHRYYGIGGLQTVSYDTILQSRQPSGRYYASDVDLLNRAFDKVHEAGGIFYAMWHSDRYENSVIHDMREGADGASGSTLMQHLAHVANRPDVWYVANGWLCSYRYVAENVQVTSKEVEEQ